MAIKSVQTLDGHTDRVWTIAWNPSGTILASSGADKTIRLWAQEKSENYICMAILTNTHNKSIRRLCWSPCGNYLASASFDSTVCIWKKNPIDNNWATVVNLEGHESEVKSVAWSSDGNYLASCGRDRTIWIWERALDRMDEVDSEETDEGASWDCSDVKNDHTKDVKQIVWHPHYNILVSCSYDDTVKLFHKDGDDWNCFQTLTTHSSTVWSADFSESGQYLVTSSDDRTVRVWKNHSHDKLPAVEANSWKCVSVIQGYHSRSIYDVSWSKTSDVIASCSGDNSLVIYGRDSSGEPQDGDMFTCVERLSQAHDCDVNTVVWNPRQSGLLATGGDDRKIKIWNYSADDKGRKPLTIVDELMKALSDTCLDSTGCKMPDNTASNQPNEEPKLTFHVNDFSHLLNLIKILQRLQNEAYRDEEKESLLKNVIDCNSTTSSPRPVAISGLCFNESDGSVGEFNVDIINDLGQVEHRFMLRVNKEFLLKLPRRSVKLVVVADELFLWEKTGDLFKISPSGQSEFLLGHLFTFSDVQFVVNKQSNQIRYIISADRDEKIRISNYPETYDIERFCFGHKSLLRRIVVIDDERFVSIDQKDELCLWNLKKLNDKTNPNEYLIPERTMSIDSNLNKRIRTN